MDGFYTREMHGAGPLQTKGSRRKTSQKKSRTQKQKQLPGNYSEGQTYQAAITDFKGVPSPTPAHVLHILPCLKTSCWICNVNASHFNSITSTHSRADGAKEARGAERALRFPARGGGGSERLHALFPRRLGEKKQRAKAKWMNENGTPEHGCGGGNRQKKIKNCFGYFPAISDGFDLEKLKHPPRGNEHSKIK